MRSLRLAARPLRPTARRFSSAALLPVVRDAIRDEAATNESRARAAYGQGDFRKACAANQRVIELLEKLENDERLRLAAAHLNNALTHQVLAEPREAFHHAEKALALLEPEYSARKKEVAHCLDVLGEAAIALEVPAESWLRRALDVKTVVYGAWHEEVAVTCNLLGGACVELGEFEEAKKFFRRALAIHSRGPLDQGAAVALSNLATVLKHGAEEGDLEKAVPLVEKVVELLRACKSPLLGRALCELGASYVRRGGPAASARPVLQEAVRLQSERLGVEHPEAEAAASWLMEAMAMPDDEDLLPTDPSYLEEVLAEARRAVPAPEPSGRVGGDIIYHDMAGFVGVGPRGRSAELRVDLGFPDMPTQRS